MAQTRMPAGQYKKVLIRLTPEIHQRLLEDGKRERRSLTGQLVYTLEKCLDIHYDDGADKTNSRAAVSA